jgi:glycosyltransferase involved in cell wall biosynthesis
MRVLLAIRSLHIGGAERQVVSLAKTMATLGAEVHIATIVAGGPLEHDLSNIPNIQVHNLGKPGLIGKIRYLLRLRSYIKSNRYDAVYGFLPTPNLALLVARTLRNRPRIVWGVRSSGLNLSQYNRRVKWAMRLEKWLSKFSDSIITNSQAALEEYRQNGYPYSKISHIPNAINVHRFKPDPVARNSVRNELALAKDAPVIGIFARLHPMKDHLTFLRAAKILVETVPDTRFICAGGTSLEYSSYEQRIKSTATEFGLENRVLWLGPRNDPESLMVACDLTTLTSNNGEGFPNSVAESMACGVPCVVTDIGDSATITENFSVVVPPENPEELVRAWKSALQQDQATLKKTAVAARDSIIDRYSPSKIAQKTLTILANS